MVTDDSEVGIDIEYVEPIKQIEDLFIHFSEKEKEYLLKKVGKEREIAFYEIWVIKESYVKAIGMGVSCSFSSFSISMDKKQPYIDSQNPPLWFFQLFSVKGGYKCSVCSKHQYVLAKPIYVKKEALLC